MTAHDDHVSILREAYAQWVHTKGSDCECWMNIIADDVSLGSLADGSPEVPLRHAGAASPAFAPTSKTSCVTGRWSPTP